MVSESNNIINIVVRVTHLIRTNLAKDFHLKPQFKLGSLARPQTQNLSIMEKYLCDFRL